MINVDVNAKSIIYNPNADGYGAVCGEELPPKCFYFHDGASNCAQSNRSEHLMLKLGTITSALPPV